jgi:alcohol dehydrogenase, propanol-preferring
MQVFQRRARLEFVGLFDGELGLNLVTVPTRAYRFIRSYTGALNDLMKLVSVVKRGLNKALVSSQFKLKEPPQSLQILKDRKIVGRGEMNL